jgi:hypothetical protein
LHRTRSGVKEEKNHLRECRLPTKARIGDAHCGYGPFGESPWLTEITRILTARQMA